MAKYRAWLIVAALGIAFTGVAGEQASGLYWPEAVASFLGAALSAFIGIGFVGYGFLGYLLFRASRKASGKAGTLNTLPATPLLPQTKKGCQRMCGWLVFLIWLIMVMGQSHELYRTSIGNRLSDLAAGPLAVVLSELRISLRIGGDWLGGRKSQKKENQGK